MAASRRSKPPSLLRNPLSLVGALIAIISTAFGLPMMFVDMFSRQTNPYLGVLVYLVLPLSATGGVGLMALGAVWERRRRARHPGAVVHPLPLLDLNRPSHQLAVAGAMTGLLILIVLLSVTSYRAYHFTESVQFCGTVCHQVMKPVYTAYQHSPHARVACVECHVGPGAGWFVRSKLSGLYQVYATLAETYPRPIPTPIEDLRPAQETCEQCHWPTKFFGAKQKVFQHYLADEANSPWQIQMLIHVGGGDPARSHSVASGIHWHMNIKNTIEYLATDERRQVIPWVRATDLEGRVTEYVSTEQPVTSEQIAAGPIRQMDCVDCHNQPSHKFEPPDRAVELAMEAGHLDRRLPYLKREAVRLLAGEYTSEAQAHEAIAKGLDAFYAQTYPELYGGQPDLVRQTAEEVQRIYSRHFFPEMRTDWRAYPDHAGHLNSAGCFRCHDGLHRSAEGKVITNDCASCHTILAQGPPEEASTRLRAQPFQHPVDVGADVTQFQCSECHTGTTGL
jgi:nitrate/TMAO reductase-like tetraheme cytochrome c subunit